MSSLKIILHIEKIPSRKKYQNLRYLQGKYLWRTFVIIKPFVLAVYSNFSYDSEANDLMKPYFETLLEILISAQFKLYTLHCY